MGVVLRNLTQSGRVVRLKAVFRKSSFYGKLPDNSKKQAGSYEKSKT